MEPIRILYINGGPMNRGGIESYMMNYYRHFDRNKIQIDFVALGLQKSAYDDEIESLGGKIYYLPKKSKNYIGYVMGLRKIFRSGKYKIVHTHMDAIGMTVLKEAKKCKIPVRIAHSHNTQHLTNNPIKLIILEHARKNINKYATHRFACSEEAGRWLFGDYAFEKGQVEIIKNAIDIDKYKYNENNRFSIRKKYNISNDDFVIGHVGRFDYQKNHLFLIEVFSKVVKKIIGSKLVLVGNGILKGEIEKKVKELQIDESVKILEFCDNVNEVYSAFDLFVLPSKFEGLGIVAIEAQANGLNCLLSDKVPNETQVSEKVKYLSINNTEEWVSFIYECYMKKTKTNRNVDKYRIINLGYDINIESKKLEKKYILLNEKFKR